MRALIIDDEVHCREVIQSFVQDYCPLIESVEEADSVKSGLSKIKSFKPDLVFLDIQLKNETCFELLDQLDQINFQIIFTTAYDNYAVKAFEYAALHYLLKPLTPKPFTLAVNRCIPNKFQSITKAIEKAKGFYLETTYNAFNIRFEEITYIEADGSYSTIHQLNDDDIFTSKKLSEYKTLLDENFYRIHHSFIVNMKFVSKIDKKNNSVILTNGIELAISRRKKSAFRIVLEKRLNDHL
ncbi:MAG: two-component system LytT family response regulator [Crocinitomix sp.]|jgi:two-component system LytT family response regulator